MKAIEEFKSESENENEGEEKGEVKANGPIEVDESKEARNVTAMEEGMGEPPKEIGKNEVDSKDSPEKETQKMDEDSVPDDCKPSVPVPDKDSGEGTEDQPTVDLEPSACIPDNEGMTKVADDTTAALPVVPSSPGKDSDVNKEADKRDAPVNDVKPESPGRLHDEEDKLNGKRRDM